MNRWTSTEGLAIPVTSADPCLNCIQSVIGLVYTVKATFVKKKLSPTNLLNVTGD
jgi:hypothetical protein